MIYLESIQIKGYKGFEDSGEIILNIPDGTLGSGLNIFVGENGSGKTTVLKALNIIGMSPFSAQSKISVGDFNDIEKEIEIIGKIKDNALKLNMPTPWKQSMDIKEIHIGIKPRDRKSPGKLLSPQFTISSILEPINKSPERWTKSHPGTEISDFFLSYDNERINEPLTIFYFDETRTNQSKKGYYTTFSRVMEDYNRRFLKEKNNQKAIILEARNSYKEKILIENEDINLDFIKDFNNEDISSLTLDFLKLDEPYTDAFFCKTDGGKQIALSELGSGIDLIFSILFLKEIASKTKGTIVFCIDEPELSLHPQWEKKLFEILKEEAKNKQIFITTHSLHFIDSDNLHLIKKFSKRGNDITIKSFNKTEGVNFKNLFYLENREIFFSKKVILVEGISDKDRINQLKIKLFLQKQGLDFFVMFGLNNFSKAQKICEILDIEFLSIVDLDFLSRKYQELTPNLTTDELSNLEEIRIIDQLIKDNLDEKVGKVLNDVRNKMIEKNKCVSSKIILKSTSDETYRGKINKKIAELKAKKVNVLSKGMIEDYLDEDGNIINDTNGSKVKEMKNILNIQ